MSKKALQLAAISLLLAQVVYFHVLSSPSDTVLAALAVVVVLAILISGAAWFPFSEWMNSTERVSRHARLPLRCVWMLVIGILAVWVVPIRPAPERESALAVTALGTHGEQAQSSEVWVRLVVDGKDVPFDALDTDGKWIERGGLIVSLPPKQPATFRWRGIGTTGELRFVSHSWSGRVRVTHDRQTEEFELFDPGKKGDVVVPLFQAVHGKSSLDTPYRRGIQWYAMLLDALLVGGIVVLAFDALSGRLRRKAYIADANRSLARDMLAFAAVPASMSVALLLLFAPGIMTSDSYDQWTQVTNHRFHDWHPPLHTLLEGALRLAWDDPAIIALAQGIAMAMSCGLLIAVVRQASASPRWAAYVGSILLAVHPLVSVMTITLWKDVFYTVGAVLLVAGTVAIVCLGKRPIARPLGFVGALVVCIACLSFRHNGGPLLIAVAALCMVLRREGRWRIAGLFVVALVLNTVLNGPVMDAIGVHRVHIPFTIASHHIAAHLANGEMPASADDRALLGSIGEWKYNCASVDDTIFNKQYKSNVAAENSGRLVRIAMGMALASPRVELTHLACVSSLVWRMSILPGEPGYLARTGLHMDGDHVGWMYKSVNGEAERSPLGRSGESVRTLLLSEQSDAWFDRPATYLYALLFACAIVVGRDMARWRVAACIAVAALAQSASLLFFNVAQDARYQLPVYVLALCLVPCLFTALRRPLSLPVRH